MSEVEIFAEGNKLREEGDLDGSIACYEKTADDETTSDDIRATALFFKAIAMQEKDEFQTEDLIDIYSTVIDIKKLPHALNNRGLLYQRIGNFDAAITDYKSSIEVDSSVVSAYFNLANIHDENGNHEDAVEYYSSAIRIKPDYAAAFLNKGVALDCLGDYTSAIHCYQKAAILLPLDPSPYHNKGVSLNQIGDFTEALSAFSKALILKPDYYSALVNKALSHINVGDREEAESCLREAISIRPKSDTAYIYEALICHCEVEKRVKLLEKTINDMNHNVTEEIYNEDLNTAMFYKASLTGLTESDSEVMKEAIVLLSKMLVSEPNHALALICRAALVLKKSPIHVSISPAVIKDLKTSYKMLCDNGIVIHDTVADREILTKIVSDLVFSLEPELCSTIDPSFNSLNTLRRSFLTNKLLSYLSSFPRSLKTIEILSSDISLIKNDVSIAKRQIRAAEVQLLILLKSADSNIASPEAFTDLRTAKTGAERGSIIQQIQNPKKQQDFGCQNCVMM